MRHVYVVVLVGHNMAVAPYKHQEHVQLRYFKFKFPKEVVSTSSNHCRVRVAYYNFTECECEGCVTK